jgi:hypothetical protein
MGPRLGGPRRHSARSRMFQFQGGSTSNSTWGPPSCGWDMCPPNKRHALLLILHSRQRVVCFPRSGTTRLVASQSAYISLSRSSIPSPNPTSHTTRESHRDRTASPAIFTSRSAYPNLHNVSRQSKIRGRPRRAVPRRRPARIATAPRIPHLSAQVLAHRSCARIPAPICILHRRAHAQTARDPCAPTRPCVCATPACTDAHAHASSPIITPQPPPLAEPPRPSALCRSLTALIHLESVVEPGPERIRVQGTRVPSRERKTA